MPRLSKIKSTLAYGAAVAALLGILTSGYALYQHYTAQDTQSFCDINTLWSCSAVNKSHYAAIAGFPVAAVGLIGYLLLLILIIYDQRRSRRWTIPFAVSVLGLVFQMYYTGIEFFVLRTACVLCVTSQITIALVAGLTGFLYFSSSREPRNPPMSQ